jgi:hypothetical protein
MTDGGWIFLIVIVLLFVALVYGFYTRRGSAINQRPYDPARGDGASGAAGPSRRPRTKPRECPTLTAPDEPALAHGRFWTCHEEAERPPSAGTRSEARST